MDKLPFEVGQEAEAKSFIVGYRSAWFRCKIKDISKRRGKIGIFLEYYDFPEEKVTWTKLYQRSPGSNSKSGEELILRPCFPPFYQESQLPDSYPKSDVIAVVKDDWQVGDLVDWWRDDCFWFGRITHILGNGNVQVELPKPPIGEGSSYVANHKDLRPSLNWSPEDGWTVPMSRESGNSKYCVRLVRSIGVDERSNEGSHNTPTKEYAERNDVKPTSASDSLIPHDEEMIHMKESPRVARYSTLKVEEKAKIKQFKYMPSVKRAETVEDAIMQLEELALKLKFVKKLANSDSQLSNGENPVWELDTNPDHAESSK